MNRRILVSINKVLQFKKTAFVVSGIDPMAPFWMMKPRGVDDGWSNRLHVRDVTKPLVYNLQLFVGHLDEEDVFPVSENRPIFIILKPCLKQQKLLKLMPSVCVCVSGCVKQIDCLGSPILLVRI